MQFGDATPPEDKAAVLNAIDRHVHCGGDDVAGGELLNWLMKVMKYHQDDPTVIRATVELLHSLVLNNKQTGRNQKGGTIERLFDRSFTNTLTGLLKTHLISANWKVIEVISKVLKQLITRTEERLLNDRSNVISTTATSLARVLINILRQCPHAEYDLQLNCIVLLKYAPGQDLLAEGCSPLLLNLIVRNEERLLIVKEALLVINLMCQTKGQSFSSVTEWPTEALSLLIHILSVHLRERQIVEVLIEIFHFISSDHLNSLDILTAPSEESILFISSELLNMHRLDSSVTYTKLLLFVRNLVFPNPNKRDNHRNCISAHQKFFPQLATILSNTFYDTSKSGIRIPDLSFSAGLETLVAMRDELPVDILQEIQLKISHLVLQNDYYNETIVEQCCLLCCVTEDEEDVIECSIWVDQLMRFGKSNSLISEVCCKMIGRSGISVHEDVVRVVSTITQIHPNDNSLQTAAMYFLMKQSEALPNSNNSNSCFAFISRIAVQSFTRFASSEPDEVTSRVLQFCILTLRAISQKFDFRISGQELDIILIGVECLERKLLNRQLRDVLIELLVNTLELYESVVPRKCLKSIWKLVEEDIKNPNIVGPLCRCLKTISTSGDDDDSCTRLDLLLNSLQYHLKLPSVVEPVLVLVESSFRTKASFKKPFSESSIDLLISAAEIHLSESLISLTAIRLFRSIVCFQFLRDFNSKPLTERNVSKPRSSHLIALVTTAGRIIDTHPTSDVMDVGTQLLVNISTGIQRKAVSRSTELCGGCCDLAIRLLSGEMENLRCCISVLKTCLPRARGAAQDVNNLRNILASAACLQLDTSTAGSGRVVESNDILTRDVIIVIREMLTIRVADQQPFGDNKTTSSSLLQTGEISDILSVVFEICNHNISDEVLVVECYKIARLLCSNTGCSDEELRSIFEESNLVDMSLKVIGIHKDDKKVVQVALMCLQFVAGVADQKQTISASRHKLSSREAELLMEVLKKYSSDECVVECLLHVLLIWKFKVPEPELIFSIIKLHPNCVEISHLSYEILSNISVMRQSTAVEVLFNTSLSSIRKHNQNNKVIIRCLRCLTNYFNNTPLDESDVSCSDENATFTSSYLPALLPNDVVEELISVAAFLVLKFSTARKHTNPLREYSEVERRVSLSSNPIPSSENSNRATLSKTTTNETEEELIKNATSLLLMLSRSICGVEVMLRLTVEKSIRIIEELDSDGILNELNGFDNICLKVLLSMITNKRDEYLSNLGLLIIKNILPESGGCALSGELDDPLVGIVLGSLMTYSTNTSICCSCLFIIRSVSLSGDLRRNIVQSEGFHKILSCASKHFSSIQIQQLALQTISMLCHDGDNLIKLSKSGFPSYRNQLLNATNNPEILQQVTHLENNIHKVIS